MAVIKRGVTFKICFRKTSNVNSCASGGCHPHFKFATHLLKQFSFHLPFHDHEYWIIVFILGTSNWNLGNCLRKLHPKLPKHSINKDKTLTISLDNLPLNAILKTFYKCFIICDLWNNSDEKQVWKIFNIAWDYSVISSFSLAHENMRQGMGYK